MRQFISAVFILSTIFLTHCAQCESDPVEQCSLENRTTNVDSLSYQGGSIVFKKQIGHKGQRDLFDTTVTIQLDGALPMWNPNAASLIFEECQNRTAEDVYSDKIVFGLVLNNGAELTFIPTEVIDETQKYSVEYYHAINDSTIVFGNIEESGTLNREVLSHTTKGPGSYTAIAHDSFEGSKFNYVVTHTYSYAISAIEGCGDGFLRTH
ncbi:MAG: hypothetical protein OCC49_15040 [Fibrobacterales bacterium]